MWAFTQIFRFLPICFLAISISPNFTGNSILRALITVPIFLPAITQLWIKEPLNDTIKANLFSLKMLVSLISGTLFVYFQLEFPILILISVIALVIAWGLDKIFPQVTWYYVGLTVFCLNYLNINTYEFEHIFRWYLILPAVFSLFYFGMWKNILSAVIGIIAITTYFGMNDFFDFAIYTLVAGLVVLSGHYYIKIRNITEIIGGLGFLTIFICYLLFGVNLIQAL